MKLKRRIRKIRAKIASYPPLAFTLGGAVAVALVLTVVSTGIYYMAGFYKFDLSRPGYEKERAQVTNDNKESQRVYDTTSPVTASSMGLFLKDFDANAQKAAANSDFRDDSLSDQQLQLPPQ